jgi:hypothetical protein
MALAPVLADEMQPIMVSDASLPRFQADIEIRYDTSKVNAILSFFDYIVLGAWLPGRADRS